MDTTNVSDRPFPDDDSDDYDDDFDDVRGISLLPYDPNFFAIGEVMTTTNVIDTVSILRDDDFDNVRGISLLTHANRLSE